MYSNFQYFYCFFLVFFFYSPCYPLHWISFWWFIVSSTKTTQKIIYCFLWQSYSWVCNSRWVSAYSLLFPKPSFGFSSTNLSNSVLLPKNFLSFFSSGHLAAIWPLTPQLKHIPCLFIMLISIASESCLGTTRSNLSPLLIFSYVILFSSMNCLLWPNIPSADCLALSNSTALIYQTSSELISFSCPNSTSFLASPLFSPSQKMPTSTILLYWVRSFQAQKSI